MKQAEFENKLSLLANQDPEKFLEDWKNGKIDVTTGTVSAEVYQDMERLSAESGK